MSNPLVLLPGLLCDAAVWADVRRALAGVHCVVPSYGTLDSLTAMAELVLSQAPPRFALAGHSMGGRVALEILRLAPQRVERLALLDTGVDPRPDGAAGQAEAAKRHALLEIARGDGMRAMAQQWAPGMVHPMQLERPVYEQVLEMVARQTPEIFAAQIRALLARPDAREVLAGARCPTLLLCGRQDAWSPLARHELMLALQPAAQLAVVEDCGHMSTMEQPHAVAAALQSWLAQPAG